MVRIKVSRFLLVTASKAGSTVREMAFLKNWSWLPFFLTSICTNCLSQSPQNSSDADNLVLLHFSRNWKNLVDETRLQFLCISMQTWRLKLSHIKTITAAFCFNNRETKCELKVCDSNKLSPFCPVLFYLGRV